MGAFRTYYLIDNSNSLCIKSTKGSIWSLFTTKMNEIKLTKPRKREWSAKLNYTPILVVWIQALYQFKLCINSIWSLPLTIGRPNMATGSATLCCNYVTFKVPRLFSSKIAQNYHFYCKEQKSFFNIFNRSILHWISIRMCGRKFWNFDYVD